MWFPLAPTDLDYTRTSPYRLHFEGDIDATPQRVFEIFTQDDMKEWFSDVKSMRWTSPLPRGEGSTRIVALKALAVKERFLVWQPGERVTFRIEACSLPLVKAMMEDFRIFPVGKARARVEYTIHYTPGLIIRAVHPLARAIFGKMFRSVVKGVTRVAERSPARSNGAGVRASA